MTPREFSGCYVTLTDAEMRIVHGYSFGFTVPVAARVTPDC